MKFNNDKKRIVRSIKKPEYCYGDMLGPLVSPKTTTVVDDIQEIVVNWLKNNEMTNGRVSVTGHKHISIVPNADRTLSKYSATATLNSEFVTVILATGRFRTDIIYSADLLYSDPKLFDHLDLLLRRVFNGV